jgi:hypothetical protein
MEVVHVDASLCIADKQQNIGKPVQSQVCRDEFRVRNLALAEGERTVVRTGKDNARYCPARQ